MLQKLDPVEQESLREIRPRMRQEFEDMSERSRDRQFAQYATSNTTIAQYRQKIIDMELVE